MIDVYPYKTTKNHLNLKSWSIILFKAFSSTPEQKSHTIVEKSMTLLFLSLRYLPFKSNNTFCHDCRTERINQVGKANDG